MIYELPDDFFKKFYYSFSSYCPLQISVLNTCQQDITARDLKPGQLIENHEKTTMGQK